VPAFAAAADAEGAGRIAKTLQAYLTDTAGVVSVTPNGDVYDLKIDLAPLFAKLPGKDVVINVSPLALTLSDQGGGKWKVDQDQSMSLTFKAPGAADVEMKIDQVKGSGIFDEALGAFESTASDLKGLSLNEDISAPGQPPTHVDYNLSTLHYESANHGDGNSGMSGASKMTSGVLTEKVQIGANQAASTPAMDFVVTADKYDADVKYDGVKAKPVMSLLAYLVSHANQEAMIRDQQALKDALRAALPIWNSISMTGTASNIKVGTMLGDFGLPSMSFAVDFSGLTQDAKFREAFTIDGFTAPAALIPPWATQLVPTKLTMDFNAGGFDLAAPAALFLDKADFTKTPPLPPDLEAELGKLALPKGTFTVGMGPSLLANALSQLKFEGAMEVDPNMGKGAIPPAKADVNLTGFDKLIAALQSVPKEMGVAQMMPAAMLVKGMAKAESDGSLSWHVETNPNGAVTVNGVDLTKMGGGG
jgi:hypothetical protein